jgi:hypothetical protein
VFCMTWMTGDHLCGVASLMGSSSRRESDENRTSVPGLAADFGCAGRGARRRVEPDVEPLMRALKRQRTLGCHRYQLPRGWSDEPVFVLLITAAVPKRLDHSIVEAGVVAGHAQGPSDAVIAGGGAVEPGEGQLCRRSIGFIVPVLERFLTEHVVVAVGSVSLVVDKKVDPGFASGPGDFLVPTRRDGSSLEQSRMANKGCCLRGGGRHQG